MYGGLEHISALHAYELIMGASQSTRLAQITSQFRMRTGAVIQTGSQKADLTTDLIPLYRARGPRLPTEAKL